PRAAAAIAVDAMPNADDAAESLQIDMHQIAGVRPLVALDRRDGVKQRDPIEPDAGEHARNRGARLAERGADLPGGQPATPQGDDRPLTRGGGAARVPLRGGRRMLQ